MLGQAGFFFFFKNGWAGQEKKRKSDIDYGNCILVLGKTHSAPKARAKGVRIGMLFLRRRRERQDETRPVRAKRAGERSEPRPVESLAPKAQKKFWVTVGKSGMSYQEAPAVLPEGGPGRGASCARAPRANLGSRNRPLLLRLQSRHNCPAQAVFFGRFAGGEFAPATP